ncbi:thioredoxin family protein, partial [Rhizobium ruizarguesonis]
EAVAAGGPVLVHVTAPWCGECKLQKPIVAKLLGTPDFKEMKEFKVDFDTQKDASGVVPKIEGQEGAASLLLPHQFPDLGKRFGRIGQVQAQGGSCCLSKMARCQLVDELGPGLEFVGVERAGDRRLLFDVRAARAAAAAVRRHMVFNSLWRSLSP